MVPDDKNEKPVDGGEMTVAIDPNGKSVVVEFTVEKLIADWQVRHVENSKTVQSWTGRTDDNLADAAPVDPKALHTGSTLAWSVLLYGPAVAMTVQVLVEVRQGVKVLGSHKQDIAVDAKKAKINAGTIHIS